MTCNVLILGSVLRLNKFEMVDMESPDSVFAPSMALHQFCYALFYVHQIHLLIILYVSTEKKIVAKSIVDMSQMRYIDNTKPKEGIL